MEYGVHLGILVLLWATLALSQSFLTGYHGILAVHQAAAWAIGAYVAALLDRGLGMPIYGAILPAGLVAGAFMVVAIGWVSRGPRDDQVLASLCVQMIVVSLLTNLTGITGGPLGVVGIGSDAPHNSRLTLAAFAAAAVLAATLAASVTFARSSLGPAWLTARDDRAFAESLGIDVPGGRRLAAFAAAAAAGAAGAVYAHFTTYIEPASFGLAESVAILAIAVIGGAPRAIGVVFAAFVVVLAPEFFRAIGLDPTYVGNVRQALFGLLLIAAIAWPRRP